MSEQERPVHASFSNKWQGLGSALPFLLVCDALAVLALSAGNVAVSWWIVTKGGAAHLSAFALAAALAMLGPAIAGVALGMMEVSAVYAGFGLSLLLVTMAFPLVPGIRQFLALDHGALKGWNGKQHPTVFGLGVVAVKRVAP